MKAAQPEPQTVVTEASMVLIPREDPMGKMLFVCLVLIIGLVTFIAFMALLTALMPRFRNRCQAAAMRSTWTSLLVGLVGWGVLGSLAWWLYSGAFVKMLLETKVHWGKFYGSIAVLFGLLLVTYLGATGVVAYVGRRIGEMSGKTMSPMRQVVWATLIIVLACWFPVGWVTVAPLLMAISFGAVFLAFRYRPEDGESS